MKLFKNLNIGNLRNTIKNGQIQCQRQRNSKQGYQYYKMIFKKDMSFNQNSVITYYLKIIIIIDMKIVNQIVMP